MKRNKVLIISGILLSISMLLSGIYTFVFKTQVYFDVYVYVSDDLAERYHGECISSCPPTAANLAAAQGGPATDKVEIFRFSVTHEEFSRLLYEIKIQEHKINIHYKECYEGLNFCVHHY